MTNRDPEQRPDALAVARTIHEFSTTGTQAAHAITPDATAMSTVAAPVPADAQQQLRSHDDTPTVAAPVPAPLTAPPAVRRDRRSTQAGAQEKRPVRRAVVIIVVFAVLLLAAIAIAIAVASSNGSSPDQTPLPEVTGPLGVHLEQLRDEVNQ